jgi:hypothetical protein
MIEGIHASRHQGLIDGQIQFVDHQRMDVNPPAALTAALGDRYREFASSRARLIPYVW